MAFNHTLIASSSSEVDWAQLSGFYRSYSQLLTWLDVHNGSLTYMAESVGCGLGAMLSLSNGTSLWSMGSSQHGNWDLRGSVPWMCSKKPSKGHKTFYDLASAMPECSFSPILMVKLVAKTWFKSKREIYDLYFSMAVRDGHGQVGCFCIYLGNISLAVAFVLLLILPRLILSKYYMTVLVRSKFKISPFKTSPPQNIPLEEGFIDLDKVSLSSSFLPHDHLKLFS